MRELGLRLASAILLAGLALAALVAGGWIFAGFLAACGLLACWEWHGLAGDKKSAHRLAIYFYLLVHAVGMGFGFHVILREVEIFHANLWLDRDFWLSLFLLTGITACFAQLVALYGRDFKIPAYWPMAGVALLFPPVFLLLMMAEMFPGAFFVLCFILLVCASDMGGYFIGKWLGGRGGLSKPFPTLSPGKSWAGIGGGFLFAALAGWLLYSISLFAPLYQMLLAALLISLAAQLGDLAESAIKRGRGVKDSGTLMPGHGGLLDRVDGLIGALFLVYFPALIYYIYL